MKKSWALILTTVFFKVFTAAAADSDGTYSRGMIIAVDTRDRIACEAAQKRVEAMTGLKVSQVCAQDGRYPYSVAIITVPTDEFDFVNEVSPRLSRKPQVEVISNPQLGTLYVLSKSKDTDQYFRLVARRHEAEITVFRLEEYGGMQERRETSLLYSFVLKSNSSERTSNKIAHSVSRRLIYNRSSLDMNEDQYRHQATKAASLMDSINGAVHQALDTDRASLNLFRPPKNCDENRYCPEGEGYSFGLGITIRF